MGMIVVKAFMWVVILSAIWAVIAGLIKGVMWACAYVRDAIGNHRDEKAYVPIRAARLKASDDALRAAIDRANAFLEQERKL